MFLKSVLGGLGTLVHWQVLLALLIYVLARFGWLMLIGAIMGRSDSGVREGTGCLMHMIGGYVFQGLLLGLLVLVLIPLMLGGNSFLPFAFFRELSWPILKACIYAMVAVLILSFLPIVGRLISGLPGVDDFIQGMIIFHFFSSAFIESQLKGTNLPTDIYPGFWESAGYLAVAVILIFAFMFGFAALGIKISRNRYSDDESVGFFLTFTVMPLAGLLPLFMYAKHVYFVVERMIK